MSLHIVDALKDPNRYLDVFPMGVVADDPDSYQYTDDPDEILFYDFMVRSEEADDVYCEVENISPNDYEAVESMLLEIYNLNGNGMSDQEPNIIEALPFLLVPLSTQISNEGGAGYNSDVNVQRIENSFSALYTFSTEKGDKTIKSPNTFRVGVVDAEVNHFVEYHADDGEYVLITRKETKMRGVLLVKSLGFSFEEMEGSLKELWPNRVLFDLTNPSDVAE